MVNGVEGVKMEKKINYRGLFFAGMIFLASGVPLIIALGPVGIAVLGAGSGLMAIGLGKRGEWT